PRMSLTLQIAYEVQQGRLFQLPVLLPANWEVERVELNPAGLLQNWSVRPPALAIPGANKAGVIPARSTLLVDLQRPLTAVAASEVAGPPGARPRPVALTVRLQPVQPQPLLGRELAFPQAQPLGAHLHEGAFAIEFDEQVLQATVKTSSHEGDPEEEGLWGNRTPDHYYPYSGQPVQGAIVLN